MKKKLLLFILFIVLLISLSSLLLIIFFVDPYSNKAIWVISIIGSFVLSVTSFFTLFLYIVKKIYYRGDVFLYHVYTSFRQWFFLSLFASSLFVLYYFDIYGFVNIIWVFMFLFFTELFIKNLEET